MDRRHLLAGTTLALASLAFAPAVLAADVADPHPAHIHSGLCPTPGDVVAPLTDVAPPAGDAMGQGTAIVVGSSVTTVPIALSDIVGAPHSINVHESQAAMDLYIACGDIGGTMVTDADLAIGIGEQNGSGLSGVAWLHDNGDDTTAVYVFLTPTATGTAPGASMMPGASMVPGASMMPGASMAPGASMMPGASMAPDASAAP